MIHIPIIAFVYWIFGGILHELFSAIWDIATNIASNHPFITLIFVFCLFVFLLEENRNRSKAK